MVVIFCGTASEMELQRLEQVLNNKNELFPKKAESLVEVWKQVSQYSPSGEKQYVMHLMDWAKLHTLNIILTGEWKKYKDVYEEKLLVEVKNCEMVLLNLNNIFSSRCRKLAEVIKDPWGNPILNRLLNNPDATIGPEEIEFFCMETGYLVSMRLKKLCESQCEDLALNLVSSFMRCDPLAEAHQYNLNATEDQKRFILDVYIALLYKYKKTSLILTTLKSFSLKEGFELVKRFANKRVNISKIWRHCRRITHLAAQVFVTAAIMKPIEESADILDALLDVWLAQNESTEHLDAFLCSIRRIIQAAESAKHVYIFCEAIHRKFGSKIKTFTIELFIRALTTDMNNMERQKNEDDPEKLAETSEQLANGFLRLADVLEEHGKVSRECVLTSFSLRPTEPCLQRIVQLAERCGQQVLDTGQDWKCKLHPPVLTSDELSWQCHLCGDYMSQPQIESALNTNTALSEALTTEHLGLSPQLCDDLAVVLSSPRYQVLSWLLPWRDLHRVCILYLHNPARIKNLVTELKFLDIDYSMFINIKREPEDDEELTGIERGYEHFLEDDLYSDEHLSPPFSEDSASQESRPYSLGSDGMGESPQHNFVPLPTTKSDPDVLRSLRMFRPNLKRPKPVQAEDELPPKIFVKSIAPSSTFAKTAIHGNAAPVMGAKYVNTLKDNEYKFSIQRDLPCETQMKPPLYVNNMIPKQLHNYNLDNSGPYPENLHKPKSLPNPLQTLPNNMPAMESPNKIDAKQEEILPQLNNSVEKEISKNCEDHKPETVARHVQNICEHVLKLSNCNKNLTVDICRQMDGNCAKCIANAAKNTDLEFEEFYNNNYNLHSTNPNDAAFDGGDSKKQSVDRFGLKEARVVLDRIVVKNGGNNSNKLINTTFFNNKYQKTYRKYGKKSENVRKTTEPHNQSIIKKDKNQPKLSPLQDISPRVELNLNDSCKPVVPKLDEEIEKCKQPQTNYMVPRVVLKRLELGKNRDVNAVLANVPGLNDLQMIRPSSVDRIVQVVQVAGGRSIANVPPVQNTQTSTPVTPHIQRIGQPRLDKPEQTSSQERSSNLPSTSVPTTTKSSNSEPSTLINILSQQIIQPAQSNSLRPRTAPLINILSQQIVRPANSVVTSPKVSSAPSSSEFPVNSVPRTTVAEDQSVTQLTSPSRTSASTLKTLVSVPSTEQNRIVQFICKSSDGKLIPVRSFTSGKVVKVATTQTVGNIVTSSSNSEENSTKLAQDVTKARDDNVECSETLPKFQQAFGKSAYQNNVECTQPANADGESTVSQETSDKTTTVAKTQPPKNSTASSVHFQPVQGGVIYTRQMPVSQTINLIPPGGRGQLFRIASSNSEHISLVKDTTVIHSRMLLAAALQGKRVSEVSDSDNTEESGQTETHITLSRPTLLQNTRIVKPILQIPSNIIRNSPQSNLSSTTLEQLREFDMVYKQVKERSSTSVSNEPNVLVESKDNAPQQINVTYVNQAQKIGCTPVVVVTSYCNMQPAASPSLSVTSQSSCSPSVTPAPSLPKVSTKVPKAKSIKSTTSHTSKASPIPKPQQKPQEDEHTTQRIFDILAEYAEQLRNSPDLNNKPAPRRRSNPPTNPNHSTKRKKSSSSKKPGQCSSTLVSDGDMDDARTGGSEDSSCGMVQLSVPDDEQPSIATNTLEACEASVSPKRLILSESSSSQTRNLIITDSNVGEALKMSSAAVLVPGNYIMPVSMVKGGQQIAVVSGGSKILATVPARSGPNMLLFQSFLNQTRKPGVSTVKYSTVQPISSTSSQTATTVNAQQPVILPPTSQSLATVTLGQSIALKKLESECLEVNNFKTELFLAISHTRDSNTAIIENTSATLNKNNAVALSNNNEGNAEVDKSIIQHSTCCEKTFQYENTLSSTSVATPVIAQTSCLKEELSGDQHRRIQAIGTSLSFNSVKCDKAGKPEERVQSVLVTTGTSNGPLLSHSPPTYNKETGLSSATLDTNKSGYLRNEVKRSGEAKTIQSNNVYTFQCKNRKIHSSMQRVDKELHQLSLQHKQAALERELHLQKSLSEECEDLGVDEPSTSDLFPEADLLFDSNNSPSYDQSSQDLIKRPMQHQDTKEEPKAPITLFGDDDNSSSLRGSFLFEPEEYRGAELDQSKELTNGRNSTNNESGLTVIDNTLLQNCPSVSDVTIPSPISPDPYTVTSPPPLNKYKFKYSNRKKGEHIKQVENWSTEISSSEDTSSSCSPELYTSKHSHTVSCEEELSDASIKGVHVAISKLHYSKEDEGCDEMHSEEDADCSPSGRGARRSVKKLCSCCNGSQESTTIRKRPSSRPHTPASHKKPLVTKKR